MGLSVVACGGSDKPADNGADKAAGSKTEAPAGDAGETEAEAGGEVANKDKPLLYGSTVSHLTVLQENWIWQHYLSTKIHTMLDLMLTRVLNFRGLYITFEKDKYI